MSFERRQINNADSCALACRNIAAILREEQKIERALWYADKAAELGDPVAQELTKQGHEELAASYSSKGGWDNARAEYTKLIAAHPNDAGRTRLRDLAMVFGSPDAEVKLDLVELNGIEPMTS